MKEPRSTRHNRIVINLDEATKASTATRAKKRRGRRVAAVLAILMIGAVVLIAAGLFVWWQRHKSSPAYSLALLIDAAQRNDTAGLEQGINLDLVASNMTSEVSQKAAARYGASLDQAGRQELEKFLPGLMPRVKDSLRAESTKAMQAISAEVGQKPFLLIAVALPYLVDIKSEGDTVTVRARQKPTEITMKRVEERWQVVAIKDEALAQRVVDNLIQFLPAIGQPPGATSVGRDPFRKPRRRRGR